MPKLASILRRLAWIGRQLAQVAPRDPREEVWRLRHLATVPPRRPGIASWRTLPLRYADGPAAFSQLREIFVRRDYDFHCSHAAPRILDCGSHIGLAVLRWRQLFPNADITAFEADPAIAQMLKANLAAWGDARSKVVPAAVWIQEGTIGFNRTGADNGSVSTQATQHVPSCDLASYCVRPVDLLKLDIEGAESAVLSHLDHAGALPNIRRIVCEWHQWTTGAPSLHDGLARLAANGFIYRISDASCLGVEGSGSPVFPTLRWPGNHVIVNAWHASLNTAQPES